MATTMTAAATAAAATAAATAATAAATTASRERYRGQENDDCKGYENLAHSTLPMCVD
jgi:hypothetical protein